MWDSEQPYRPEVQKCRDRLLKYCVGRGLDIGCGPEKISPHAIGVDRDGADVSADLAKGLAGNIFAKGGFDYVFSSHCLEDFVHTGELLRDWWNLLRPGGYLVLYLPHREYYPNVGQPGANPAHKHDFVPDDILRALEDLGVSYKLERLEERSQDDEYSFDLVVKKAADKGKLQILPGKPPDKKVCVLRWGAFGDHIIASSCLGPLKRDGWHVTYYGSTPALDVMANNPHIDHLDMVEPDAVARNNLAGFYEAIEPDFDQVVNLNATVECALLFENDQPEYNLSLKERRLKAGKMNYYRNTLALAGYPDAKDPRGELFHSDMERATHRMLRQKLKNRFVILWCMSGSGVHKAYPYADQVGQAILDNFPDTMIISVGDKSCQLLEPTHQRWLRRSGRWPIRDSMLFTAHADLVISPETAVLNAAGCFATPKIGFLTHSSRENLTATFVNDLSMQADINCSPCHRLVRPDDLERGDCPWFQDPDYTEPIPMSACSGAFDRTELFHRIERQYRAWKNRPQGLDIAGLVTPFKMELRE